MKAYIVRDFLYEASSEELYQKFYKDIPQDIYKQLIKVDPTSNDNKNGKYCKWLLNLYRKKGEKNISTTTESQRVYIEDLYKVKEALTLFNKYNNKIEKNQIMQYADYNQLIDAVEPFEEEDKQKDIEKEKLHDLKYVQTERIYEDNDWLVVVPKTWEASKFWGQGTKWCTASKDSDTQFNFYSNKSPLYVFISKKERDEKGRQIKYQLHFQSEQFRDAKDKTITKSIKVNDDLVNLFINKSDVINSPNSYCKLSKFFNKVLYFTEYMSKHMIHKSNYKEYLEQMSIVTRNKKIKNSLLDNMIDKSINNDYDIIDFYEMTNYYTPMMTKKILKSNNINNLYYWYIISKDESIKKKIMNMIDNISNKEILKPDDMRIIFNCYNIMRDDKLKDILINRIYYKNPIDTLCKMLYLNVHDKKYINIIKQDNDIYNIWLQFNNNDFNEEIKYDNDNMPKGVKTALIYLNILKNHSKNNDISRMLYFINRGINSKTHSSGYFGTSLRKMEVNNIIQNNNLTYDGYLKCIKDLSKRNVINYLVNNNIIQCINIK